MKRYSGYTNKTAKNLLLNAGAFCMNINIDGDEPESFEDAVSGGKLLGATRDGGSFNAKPAVRNIAVDGVPGRAKGLEALDEWDVNISANVLEITKETLSAALCGSDVDSTSSSNYDIIKAKNCIEVADYIDNIAWYGTLSGSNEPVIIVIKNALSTDGLTLEAKDKNETVIAMTFYGHYDDLDLDHPPFEIYYPKA